MHAHRRKEYMKIMKVIYKQLLSEEIPHKVLRLRYANLLPECHGHARYPDLEVQPENNVKLQTFLNCI